MVAPFLTVTPEPRVIETASLHSQDLPELNVTLVRTTGLTEHSEHIHDGIVVVIVVDGPVVVVVDGPDVVVDGPDVVVVDGPVVVVVDGSVVVVVDGSVVVVVVDSAQISTSSIFQPQKLIQPSVGPMVQRRYTVASPSASNEMFNSINSHLPPSRSYCGLDDTVTQVDKLLLTRT